MCPRPLNRGVRLIKVSFKVNKGNKFGDFGYCSLNRGCPLDTVSDVCQVSLCITVIQFPPKLPYQSTGEKGFLSIFLFR